MTTDIEPNDTSSATDTDPAVEMRRQGIALVLLTSALCLIAGFMWPEEIESSQQAAVETEPAKPTTDLAAVPIPRH
ncbi:MAG: hypothetical protein AB8G99_14585 [Planctomycetaceae bacterium]